MKRFFAFTLLLISVFAWADNSSGTPAKTNKSELKNIDSGSTKSKQDERGTDARPLAVKIRPSEKGADAPLVNSDISPNVSTAEVAWSIGDKAALISAIATVVIMLLTISLAVSTALLWKEAKRAGEIAKKSAIAAEKAADAALAALERPWIVIEGLECNRKSWIAAEMPLVAKFRIANYGNAPAFILSLNVAFFLSPGEFSKSFPDVAMPDAIKCPPSAEAMLQFINKFARPVRTHDHFHSNGLRDAVFDSGVAISAKDKSEEYFSHDIKKIEPIPGKISIETTFNAFLIGYTMYSAPNGEAGTIHFCYELGRDGIFRERYGAPFNNRQRTYEILD